MKPTFKIEALSRKETQEGHRTHLRILKEVGVKCHYDEASKILDEARASADYREKNCRVPWVLSNGSY